MSDLEDWMKSGEYLPKVMRDFHDQKDLFKAMHQTIDVKEHEYAGDVDWISGQCYVVDIFLWFMAKRGYTLQRSRKRFPFSDIETVIKDCKEIRDKAFAEALTKGEGR